MAKKARHCASSNVIDPLRESGSLTVRAAPERRSFGAELARRDGLPRGSAGQVRILDLYAENFDPVIRPAHFPVRAATERFEPMVEQARQVAAGAVTHDVAEHQA